MGDVIYGRPFPCLQDKRARISKILSHSVPYSYKLPLVVSSVRVCPVTRNGLILFYMNLFDSQAVFIQVLIRLSFKNYTAILQGKMT